MAHKKPASIRVAGEPYVLRVLRVETRDEQGRPEQVFMAHEPDQVFELSQDPEQNHFIAAYVPFSMVQPK